MHQFERYKGAGMATPWVLSWRCIRGDGSALRAQSLKIRGYSRSLAAIRVEKRSCLQLNANGREDPRMITNEALLNKLDEGREPAPLKPPRTKIPRPAAKRVAA